MSSVRRTGHVLRRLLFLSLPAILMLCLVLEAGFRLFVDVSDAQPRTVYDAANALLLFEAGQDGRYIALPEIKGHFHINAQGWNALHDFGAGRPTAETRIAVIGDSYVQAFHVDYRRALWAWMEDELNPSSDPPVVVYSFGHDGAQLSQYLHVMRYVAQTYQPDIFVITIIVNDFEESLVSDNPGHYFYLRFDTDSSGRIIEVPPRAYHAGRSVALFRVAAHSAVVRYFAYNLNLLQRLKGTRMDDSHHRPAEDDAAEAEQVRRLVRYAFQQYADVARSSGGRLLLVLDAPRETIYSGEMDEQDAQFVAYRALCIDTARDLNIPLLDLDPVFRADYEQYGQRFEFKYDSHWNERGHAVVGRAIARELLRLAWIPEQNPIAPVKQ